MTINMSENRIKMMGEIKKLSKFIDNWQVDNPYDTSKLKEHNRKFNKAMDEFFEESKFETIKRSAFY